MIPLPPDAPAWIQALHRESQPPSSQRACAHRLGISAATVNLVLNGRYPSRTNRIEALVREKLLDAPRECPVLGEISADRCLDEQTSPYYPDPIRSALSKSCPTCPNHRNHREPK
jgi:hypothetical protein